MAAKASKAVTGRPTLYSEKLALKICERVGCGESMRSICRDEAMPAMSSVFLWLNKNAEFSEHYARALEFGTSAMEEDILAIADDTSKDTHTTIYGDGSERTSPNTEWISSRRVMIDTRKWLMSKRAPRKYGERLEVDQKTEHSVAGSAAALLESIAKNGKFFPPNS